MNQAKTVPDKSPGHSESQKYVGNITSLKQVDASQNIYEITIHFKKPFNFLAGQYVWLVLKELTYSESVDRQAFSIASHDGDVNDITLVTNISDSVFKQTLSKLSEGSEVVVYGPHGSTFIADQYPSTQDYIFLAGGLGVAPFLSIIRSLQSSGNNQKIHLIYNFRAGSHPLYADELQTIQQHNPNLTVTFLEGNLTTEQSVALNQLIGKSSIVFVCGPEGYINVAAETLKLTKVEPSSIRYEQYYPLTKAENDEIKEVAQYINEIAETKESSSITLKQSGYFESIRKDLFIKLMALSIIGLGILLALQKFVYHESIIEGTNLKFIIFLCYQTISLIYYYFRRNYTSSAAISIIGLGVTILSLLLFDNEKHLESAWILLPVALIFFFLDLKRAIVTSIGFLVFCLGLTLYKYIFMDHHSLADVDVTKVTLFFFNALVALLLFYSFGKLLEKAEGTIKSRVNAFNLILKAVNESTSHIVITDKNGIVLYANKSAATNTGYSVSQIMGNTPRLWGGIMSGDFYKNFWAKKIAGGVVDQEIINRHKSGELYYVNAYVSSIRDDNDNIIGYLASENNVSSIKKKESEALDLSRRFKLATSSAKIGIWEWDVASDVLTWDNQMYKLYGINKQAFKVAYEAWLSGLHPEDRKLGDDAIQAALKGEKDYDIKFRVVWPNGSIRYLQARAFVERDSNNKPIKMIGVNWDITKDKEVDQAKTEFVSLASHQLRTPLTAIRWNAELLLEDKTLNPEQLGYIDQAYKSVLRMIDLVNSLLNVSRLDLGTLVIEPKQIDVIALAKDVVNELKPLIENKKTVLKENYMSNSPPYLADEKLTRVIILNLLSNAIKYTPATGSVQIDIGILTTGHSVGGRKMLKDGLVICVSDSGIGIPSSEATHIFSKLYRANNAQASEAEGTGLGLYIVKQIVDLSGGSVWFESVENKGASFYVALPADGMRAKQGTKSLD